MSNVSSQLIANYEQAAYFVLKTNVDCWINVSRVKPSFIEEKNKTMRHASFCTPKRDALGLHCTHACTITEIFPGLSDVDSEIQ